MKNMIQPIERIFHENNDPNLLDFQKKNPNHNFFNNEFQYLS
jgi:hypothetical protein